MQNTCSQWLEPAPNHSDPTHIDARINEAEEMLLSRSECEVETLALQLIQWVDVLAADEEVVRDRRSSALAGVSCLERRARSEPV